MAIIKPPLVTPTPVLPSRRLPTRFTSTFAITSTKTRSSFQPSGVTLTKTEWQQLCAQADQTGNSVVRIIEELANDKQPTLPIDITVTDELKQSIRLFNWSTSFGPHRSTRIAISKTKAGESPAKLREIVLKPVHWFTLIIHNRERIDMLIDMLEKEASLAAGKRKQHALAAERSLFQATWSLPSLQVDQQ